MTCTLICIYFRFKKWVLKSQVLQITAEKIQTFSMYLHAFTLKFIQTYQF